MPGYGFAKAPKDRVEAWQSMIFDYLSGRPNLMLVVLLIDGRHGLKDRDEKVMDTLKRAAVPFQLVLTKCDLVPKGELSKRAAQMNAELRSRVGALPTVMQTSSRKKSGLEELRGLLGTYKLSEDEVSAP